MRLRNSVIEFLCFVMLTRLRYLMRYCYYNRIFNLTRDCKNVNGNMDISWFICHSRTIILCRIGKHINNLKNFENFLVLKSFGKTAVLYRVFSAASSEIATMTTKDEVPRSYFIEDNIIKGVTIQVDAEKKVGQCIYDALSKNPDEICQIHAESGAQTTWARMKDRSVRCAVWMKNYGVSSDDIVVICADNQLNTSVPFFATFFVDATYSAWNHGIGIHTAQRFLRQFKPKLIFCCDKAVTVLFEALHLENTNTRLIVLDEHSSLQTLDELLDQQSQEEVDNFQVVNNKSPKDVAGILMSSGSTGFPKGVMLSHKSLLMPSLSQVNESPGKISLWYSCLDWVSCVFMTIRTTLRGDVRIIPTYSDADNLYQVIEKYKVNYVFLSPLQMNYVAKSVAAKNYNLSSVEVVFAGGVKLSREILETAQRSFPTAAVTTVYGCTEIGGALTSHNKNSKNIESNGHVLPNYQAKFRDLTTGKPVAANHNGELCIKSPTRMMGYFNNSEATKEVFDDQGWYHSGDLGYYDENGEIFIVDRLKEIMKYRCYQISPAEIEELLIAHPNIQEVAVVGVPHEFDGDRPAAFIKKAPEANVTEKDVTSLISILEDYKQLRGGIYFVNDLPKTGSGKIAKSELRNIAKTMVIT